MLHQPPFTARRSAPIAVVCSDHLCAQINAQTASLETTEARQMHRRVRSGRHASDIEHLLLPYILLKKAPAPAPISTSAKVLGYHGASLDALQGWTEKNENVVIVACKTPFRSPHIDIDETRACTRGCARRRLSLSPTHSESSCQTTTRLRLTKRASGADDTVPITNVARAYATSSSGAGAVVFLCSTSRSPPVGSAPPVAICVR